MADKSPFDFAQGVPSNVEGRGRWHFPARRLRFVKADVGVRERAFLARRSRLKPAATTDHGRLKPATTTATAG
jgi:hypothetical protein